MSTTTCLIGSSGEKNRLSRSRNDIGLPHLNVTQEEKPARTTPWCRRLYRCRTKDARMPGLRRMFEMPMSGSSQCPISSAPLAAVSSRNQSVRPINAAYARMNDSTSVGKASSGRRWPISVIRIAIRIGKKKPVLLASAWSRHLPSAKGRCWFCILLEMSYGLHSLVRPKPSLDW